MIKKLSRYIRGTDWFFVIAAPLFMLVEVFCDMEQPTLMSNIVDNGVATGDMALVWSLGLRMLLVAFLGVIGGAGCTALSSVASMRFGAKLRGGMFENIQTFSFREIDHFQTSSLITRLTNDVTQVQNMLRTILCMLIRAPFTCIFGIVMAVRLSLQLSVIFTVAIPILVLAIAFILPRAFPLFSQMQKKIDRVNTVMRENLLGVRVVKAFVAQEHEKERFNVANDDLMNWSIKAMKIVMLMFPIVTLIINMSVLALMVYGGYLTTVNGLQVGKIMAYMTYLMQVLSSLMMSIMMLIGFSRGKVSADRIIEVLDAKSTIASPADPKPITDLTVRFDHVSFKYNEDDPDTVLTDLNFTAHPGQTVAIIGSTGSGKSTLVNLISRLYDVTEGSITIGGVDVRELSLDELRSQIGVVLQESLLFSGSIEDNLRWGDGAADEAQMQAAMEAAQAEEFVSKLPEGLDAYVEQRGKNFSGGQKQRLCITRALVKNPGILILDDSTSAVDMATEAKIQQALASRMGGGLVFMIAQRVAAVRRADQIIVMDGGRISGMGTHEELLHANDIYRAIAVSQLGEEVLKGA